MRLLLIGGQVIRYRAVESVKLHEFNVFYLHYVARFNDDATLFRYAPANHKSTQVSVQ